MTSEIMRKYIRILESPILLLIIAMACYELEANNYMVIFLVVISAARCYINVITYDFIYKK